MTDWLSNHKIISGVGGLLVIIVLIALTALNWMFEEPGVEKVSSLATHVEARSVLGVFAHPDDEQLATGFLIRSGKDPEVKTAALTATRGEAGTQRPQVGRQKDLGHIRKAEALKNTWALGVETHDVLDYPDSGLKDVPLTAFPPGSFADSTTRSSTISLRQEKSRRGKTWNRSRKWLFPEQSIHTNQYGQKQAKLKRRSSQPGHWIPSYSVQNEEPDKIRSFDRNPCTTKPRPS